MSNVKNVFVTIDNVAHIPFINRLGPISTPISITETVYSNLLTLGYQVKLIKEVGIDVNGNRYPKDVGEFVPASEGQIIPDVTEPVANVYEPHPEEPKEPPVETQVYAEVKQEPSALAEEESQVEEPVDESETDEEEVAIYDIEVYNSYSTGRLRKYLAQFTAYENVFSKEDLETINNTKSSKPALLKIVQERIIPLASEE